MHLGATRPTTHRYCEVAGGAGIEMGSDGNSSRGSGVVLTVGGLDVRFLLAATDGEPLRFSSWWCVWWP